MTIWLKTCFWTWNSRKSKKLRALWLLQFLKEATGSHFQDSKFKIWLKHPGLLLVSFFAPGPFVAFSQYLNFTINHSMELFWIISLFAHIILWNLDFDMASNGRCVFEGGKLPPSSLGRVCLCNWLWGNPVFGRFSMACVSRFVLLVLIGGNKGLSIIGLPGSDSSTMQKNKYAY